MDRWCHKDTFRSQQPGNAQCGIYPSARPILLPDLSFCQEGSPYMLLNNIGYWSPCVSSTVPALLCCITVTFVFKKKHGPWYFVFQPSKVKCQFMWSGTWFYQKSCHALNRQCYRYWVPRVSITVAAVQCIMTFSFKQKHIYIFPGVLYLN